MKSLNLSQARVKKDDEFYTLKDDIQKEVSHYSLSGLKVLMPCDDPEKSKFWEYFMENFRALDLQKISCCFFGEEPYSLEYDGKETTKKEFIGFGDFRSRESGILLKDADVVITNPPFSLTREFLGVLFYFKKKFLFINNLNNLVCKEVFPYIKGNEMWLGYEHPKKFIQPDGSFKSFGNTLWWTNLPQEKRNVPLKLTKKYCPEKYPNYDNLPAINIDKLVDIPYDYDGLMGVPITFLEHYCPAQFEIISATHRPHSLNMRTKIYPMQIQHDAKGAMKVQKLNENGVLKCLDKPDKFPYYEIDGEYYVSVYGRILIKKKKDSWKG